MRYIIELTGSVEEIVQHFVHSYQSDTSKFLFSNVVSSCVCVGKYEHSSIDLDAGVKEKNSFRILAYG